jgi:signal transduction histidine kinase
VPSLVEEVGGAGLAVQLRIDGTPDGVPDGVDLSAYRIVQEGLTNVLRHGGPTAAVTIGYRKEAVAVEICDGGRGAGSPDPVPSQGSVPDAGTGSGQGLIGIRERVAVFGGTFEAGPRPGGGFRLAASLPLDEPARGSRVAQGAVTDAGEA